MNTETPFDPQLRLYRYYQFLKRQFALASVIPIGIFSLGAINQFWAIFFCCVIAFAFFVCLFIRFAKLFPCERPLMMLFHYICCVALYVFKNILCVLAVSLALGQGQLGTVGETLPILIMIFGVLLGVEEAFDSIRDYEEY